MPRRKAEIVRFIKQSVGGATQAEIAKRFKLTLDTARTHVYQINELLAGTDYEIRSQRLNKDKTLSRYNGKRPARGQFSFTGYEIVKRKHP